MDCDNVHHEEIVNLSEELEVDLPPDLSTTPELSSYISDNPPVLTPCSSEKPESSEVREYTTLESKSLSKHSPDIIYDGGILDEDDVEIKVVFDEKSDNDENDVEIDVRGIKYKIPFAIECHLCTEMMNLCLRRTRYRGQAREYPAYRCNRKGCQTFRSVRKVFSNCVTDGEGRSSPTMVYQPALGTPVKAPSHQFKGDVSEDEIDDYFIQRVCLPKLDKRNQDPSIKHMSVTDRVRRANQERATVFSEFSDQLRRDIAANKRIRVRKQINEEDEPQGTLFYISKELNPHEIIELQDIIIKTLISLRKIPPPMTMHDLPLFANCPYSKKNLESGLESAKYREDFWTAFTNSPQPPLPAGFIRRKDDTLIYRDPKPNEVPEILQENSPRKQAEAIIKYQQRKEEQDAKKMERRYTEKKFRSWASLKREFDLAETDDCLAPSPKLRSVQDGSDRKAARHVTLQELIDRMESEPNGRMTGKIIPSTSERTSEAMTWIDDKVPQPAEDSTKKSNMNEYRLERSDKEVFEVDAKPKLSSIHEVMRSLNTPTSPTLRSFSSEHADMKNSSMFFGDSHFNNNQTLYSLNPYFNPYQMASAVDSNSFYHIPHDPYHGASGSDALRSDYPFTYIHPDSGARMTDPSTFLTSFIPSPVCKMAPMSFEEGLKPRRNSEPSTSLLHAPSSPEMKEVEVETEVCEIDQKTMDDMLKFDSLIVGESTSPC